MEWHESDASEDEHPLPTRLDGTRTARKRSSRACDQCRKTKSKCQPSGVDPKKCQSCYDTVVACTFLGPSYKRGPPKGYIHAIEQRWHQVEALIGAILQCPDERVRSIVVDLKQDDLAREILARVDSGPYGPSGRRSQPADPTKEDFFASILRSNESAHVDASRARRQSRVSREIVSSSQDHGLSVVPTKEWQDNLSRCLASGSTPSSCTPDSDDGHASQRRRLAGYCKVINADWDSLLTIDNPDDESERNATEGLCQLSLDENSEVRWHGQLSGLHILGRNQRKDDRIEGGVWKLPMARVWPPSHFYSKSNALWNPNDIELPPQKLQDQLIDIYFTYIHPIFPVIHKARFLSEYNSRKYNNGHKDSPTSATSPSFSPRPDPSQEVSPLLLLSIFAIAARYTEETMPKPQDGKMWEAGDDYLEKARQLLAKLFHMSRPSTVQALLLLGFREFGIGSMEQGWLFIGTAIRMAFDLGLNCDSSKWKMHGHDLFSEEETQVRRQIWWACVVSDRYGSMYMGRPVMIKDEDFETPQLNVDPAEDAEPWQPSLTKDDIPYGPVPGRIMSAFVATSKLAGIMGAVVTQIYPVRPLSTASKQSSLKQLESRLDQWYITLSEDLRCDAASKRYTPPPAILFLHIRYWGTVLLLHRAFIPNWKPGSEDALRKSPMGRRALDLAHAAACQVGSIVNVYRETFTMKWASPFLTSFLFTASIMHLLILTIRPDNVEATLSFQHCMTALKEMTIVWPSAARAFDLLNGVQLRPVPIPPLRAPQQRYDRHKRPAQDAFEDENASDFSRQEQFVAHAGAELTPAAGIPLQPGNGVQDMSTRLMAHMLGLEVAGADSTAHCYSGNHWYPRLAQTSALQSDIPNLQYPLSADIGGDIQVLNTGGIASSVAGQTSEWSPQTSSTPSEYGMNNLSYQFDFGQYGV